MAKVTRCYGKEFSISDILYNKKNKTVFFSISLGVMGQKSVTLVPNKEGTYDMFGTYQKENKTEMYKMGKTFPVKNKDGEVVDGITQGVFGLDTVYDKDLKKNISGSNNAIFFTTHKLKEVKEINDDISKVGWVTGRFGIETESEETHQDNPTSTPSVPETTEEPETEEVPF